MGALRTTADRGAVDRISRSTNGAALVLTGTARDTDGMRVRLDPTVIVAGVLALLSIAWTAVRASGIEGALLVPALFVIAGMLGPIWGTARFTCRLLVAIGASHLFAFAASAAAIEATAGAEWCHALSLVLFASGFGVFVPLAAGYAHGPAPRSAWIGVVVPALIAVLVVLSAPTPPVLSTPQGEPIAPIASVLPAFVASFGIVAFAMPVVAVVVGVVRSVRGGTEVRGRMTLPLIALVAVALLVLLGSLVPEAAAPLTTTLFLAAAPLLPVALVAGGRNVRADDPSERREAIAAATGAALDALTPREREVLALMAQGHSNPAIGRALHISLSAVEKHAGSVFAKLGLRAAPDTHRRVAAVVAYLRDVER